MVWYVQADGVCKPHTEEPEASAADTSQLPNLLRRLSAQTPAMQQAGLCSRPHEERFDKGAAEANAADISQLPDLALELIFSSQLPNLARPACVCSLHINDQRCNMRLPL